MSTRTKIRRAGIGEIIELRHRILRTGMPIKTARFDGDDDETAWHFAAFLIDEANQEAGTAIGCASFMFKPLDGQHAWQLRGMAIELVYQKHGLGAKLLAHAEQIIPIESRIHLFWCNARLNAVPFYEKMSWNVISDEVFEIENAGLHRKMIREL